MLDLFHLLSSPDDNWWTVDYCDVFISLILTAPIHRRASIADTFLQTCMTLRGAHFQLISIIGGTVRLNHRLRSSAWVRWVWFDHNPLEMTPVWSGDNAIVLSVYDTDVLLQQCSVKEGVFDKLLSFISRSCWVVFVCTDWRSTWGVDPHLSGLQRLVVLVWGDSASVTEQRWPEWSLHMLVILY